MTRVRHGPGESSTGPAAQEHLSAADLESYSLGRLDTSRVDGIEEHLFVCAACTERLVAIEPYNYVHYSKSGPFYSRITRLRNGRFFARHWASGLEGGKEFQSRAAAKAYLSRSFSQMFPGHVCTARCGSTSPGPAGAPAE